MTKALIPQPNDKFLWVRFYLFGDVLQALADAYLVKKKFPKIRLSFLTREDYADVVKAQPYIDEVICGAKSPLSEMNKTIALLREKKYDWIASTFKGAHMPFMAWRSGIKNRLGNSNYLPFLETANIFEWGRVNGIDFHSRIEKTCFATKEATDFAHQLLIPLEGKKKIFCIIGASTVEKMWLTKYWIEFLKPLATEGWGIILNGYGEREQIIANEIMSAMPQKTVLNLVGKLNYLNMIAVVSECQIAVGNDTGPLHMAALCGVPCVGIFDYIQPPEVGYNMPWLTFAVARQEKLQTFYNKRRNSAILAEIKPQTVREKFEELLKKIK